MPRYDYDCAACGRRFEVIHGVHADAPDACALCGGGPVRKAISSPAVHFKGSGWAKKERRSAASSKSESSSADASNDAAATDASPSGEATSGKGEEASPKPPSGGDGNGIPSGPAAPAGSSPARHAD